MRECNGHNMQQKHTMKNLNELFLEELADIYSAEQQLVKALPKMAAGATAPELKSAIETHLSQTQLHVERVEQVFELLDKPPKAETCKAMEGLIAEGKKMLEEEAEPEVKDAAIIAAAQKVEHYEIASYGTLVTWAQLLNLNQSVSLLEETCSEEKETDEQLTEIAQAVNLAARDGQSGDTATASPRRSVRPKEGQR